MTTRVVNMSVTKRFDVRIDRATKWGNPHHIGRGCSRERAIELYEIHVRSRPDLMAALSELKDRTLGCWCKPLPCHGDVLVRLAEELP